MSEEELGDLSAKFLKGLLVRMLKLSKVMAWGVAARRPTSCAEVIQGCVGISWMLVGNFRMSNSEPRSRGDVEGLDRWQIEVAMGR